MNIGWHRLFHFDNSYPTLGFQEQDGGIVVFVVVLVSLVFG
jgi:hypothetical protein